MSKKKQATPVQEKKRFQFNETIVISQLDLLLSGRKSIEKVDQVHKDKRRYDRRKFKQDLKKDY